MSGFILSSPFLNGKTWWRVGFDPSTNLVTYQWWERLHADTARPQFRNSVDGLWRHFHDWPRYNLNDTYLGLPKRVTQQAVNFARFCQSGQIDTLEVAA